MKGVVAIWKVVGLWLMLVVGAASIPYGVQAQSREYILKAGFLEKFTHFVQWPQSARGADSLFRIAVVGENRFGSVLESLFDEVRVKDRAVAIAYMPQFRETTTPQMLFISGSVSSENAEKILLYTDGKPILTISEAKGFGKKGAIINLMVVDNFIRYEINLKALERSGLTMSSLLINAATLVETDEK